jgi:septal ring factor EnvC (AmiA/AmiB activator)
MKIIIRSTTLAFGAALVCSVLLTGTAFDARAQAIDPALENSRQAAQGTAQSQERINQIDTRTQELLGDYRANLKQLEQLNRYNQSQQRQVDAQRQEIASLTEDINNIASLQRAVQPLMEDMVNALEELVAADLPFLRDEREGRVERLRALMEDPSQSPAQRYRLIIEAYQIEAEYGRTIEAYRSDVQTGGVLYEDVSILRVGRLELVFVTDDDQVLKRYDRASGGWVDLDRSYLDDIKQGIRIAREQIPPDLMFIPVEAPVTAGGN